MPWQQRQGIDSGDPTGKTLSANGGAVRGDVVNLIPRQRAPQRLADAGLLNATGGRFAAVDMLSDASAAAPSTHVIGDASASMKPVAAGSGASVGWNGDHVEDIGTWFKASMADPFA